MNVLNLVGSSQKYSMKKKNANYCFFAAYPRLLEILTVYVCANITVYYYFYATTTKFWHLVQHFQFVVYFYRNTGSLFIGASANVYVSVVAALHM